MDIAERSEICRLVEGYFVSSCVIMKEGERRYGAVIGKTAEGWVRRTRQLEVAVGRRCIIDEFECPRGADWDRRVSNRIGGNLS